MNTQGTGLPKKMFARDSFIERKLCEGYVFKKLHHYGNPKDRHIRVTPDFKQVIWSTFPELVVKGSTNVTDLVDCVKRDSTASKGSEGGYAFSLLGNKRNLELQAKSDKEREQWVAYFRYLLKFNSRIPDKVDGTEKMIVNEKFFEDNEASNDLKDVTDMDEVTKKRKLLVTLLKGAKFTKHSKGKPFERLFWVSLMLDQLLWSSYTDSKGQPNGSLSTDTLISVSPERIRDDDWDNVTFKPNKALTLVFNDRHICLEAGSEQERDLWVSAFTHLIQITGNNNGEKESFYYWYSQQSILLDCDASLGSQGTSKIIMDSSKKTMKPDASTKKTTSSIFHLRFGRGDKITSKALDVTSEPVITEDDGDCELLQSILSYEPDKVAFKKFCKKNNVTILLDFLNDIESLKLNAQEEGEKLYHKYFPATSDSPLVPILKVDLSQIVSETFSNVKKCPYNSFDDLQRLVSTHLEANVIPLYMKSPDRPAPAPIILPSPTSKNHNPTSSTASTSVIPGMRWLRPNENNK